MTFHGLGDPLAWSPEHLKPSMRGEGDKVEAAGFSGALPSALWAVFLPGLLLSCPPDLFYGRHDEHVHR